MSPAEWRKLPRIDKKILHYWRAVQAHYEDIARQKAKDRQPAGASVMGR